MATAEWRRSFPANKGSESTPVLHAKAWIWLAVLRDLHLLSRERQISSAFALFIPHATTHQSPPSYLVASCLFLNARN